MNESAATTNANAVRRGIYANLKVFDTGIIGISISDR